MPTTKKHICKKIHMSEEKTSPAPLLFSPLVFSYRSALKIILNKEYIVHVIWEKRWFNFSLSQPYYWTSSNLSVTKDQAQCQPFWLEQNVFSCLRILQCVLLWKVGMGTLHYAFIPRLKQNCIWKITELIINIYE